jgi:hypothetical protein
MKANYAAKSQEILWKLVYSYINAYEGSGELTEF